MFKGIFILDIPRGAWTRITDVPGDGSIEWMPDGDPELVMVPNWTTELEARMAGSSPDR